MSTDTAVIQDVGQILRARKVAEMAQARAINHSPGSWAGQQAAIYCRISKAGDEDQTGVDRQECICRELAGRLDLMVRADRVFIDNNRSAWQRNRKRAGWDALLEAIERGELQHVIAYHPDRLMRQPADLEELLRIADEHRITLHGHAGGRNLADPDDRFILRIEVAHACRSSDDTSRRIKDKMDERARTGDPGPFVEVAVNYGKVFHAASSYVDYNGTSGALTDTFTNSVTTTVSTTFSVNLSVSFDIIATSVKADLGLSVQQTNAITTGHTIQFSIPAHQYGHAQYGSWQQHVSLEQYN